MISIAFDKFLSHIFSMWAVLPLHAGCLISNRGIPNEPLGNPPMSEGILWTVATTCLTINAHDKNKQITCCTVHRSCFPCQITITSFYSGKNSWNSREKKLRKNLFSLFREIAKLLWTRTKSCQNFTKSGKKQRKKKWFVNKTI